MCIRDSTPVHASWLNQVEVYFSIIQRKALSPNDFTDLDMIEERLTRFETRYNAAAKPFKWKFTTNDLAAQVVADGIAASVSTSTVRRWLGRGRDQTLAVPVLDLHHRPELRRQGRPGP